MIADFVRQHILFSDERFDPNHTQAVILLNRKVQKVNSIAN